MRQLSSGCFWEIEEVTGGEYSIWDYTKFSKVGTSFHRFNGDFFFIYAGVLNMPRDANDGN